MNELIVTRFLEGITVAFIVDFCRDFIYTNYIWEEISESFYHSRISKIVEDLIQEMPILSPLDRIKPKEFRKNELLYFVSHKGIFELRKEILKQMPTISKGCFIPSFSICTGKK